MSSPLPTSAPTSAVASASADELAVLRAEVHALADRAALTDLAHRLARWLDGGAGGDPARLFTEDVRASTPGGEVRGRAAVVAQARRNHDVPTHHLIGNVLVDVEGDVAEVTANVTAHFVRGAGTGGAGGAGGAGAAPGPTELGGRYVLGAERLDGRWRLCSIEVEPVWRVG